MRRIGAAILVAVAMGACQSHKAPPVVVPKNSPFFFPSFLPVSFTVEQGSVLARGPQHKAFGVALGRPATAGSFDGVVLVTAGEAAGDRQVAPTEKLTVVDVGAVRARLHDDPEVGAYVEWFANGVAVSVSGQSGTSALLVDIARRIQGTGIDAMTLASNPDGYVTIASGHFVTNTPDTGGTLRIIGPGGVSIILTTAESTVPLIFAVGGGDHVEATKVRNHDALVSTRVRVIQGKQVAQRVMAWTERPGLTISLIGNTSTEQLMPVADGLVRVTEAGWRRGLPAPPTPTTRAS